MIGADGNDRRSHIGHFDGLCAGHRQHAAAFIGRLKVIVRAGGPGSGLDVRANRQRRSLDGFFGF